MSLSTVGQAWQRFGYLVLDLYTTGDSIEVVDSDNFPKEKEAAELFRALADAGIVDVSSDRTPGVLVVFPVVSVRDQFIRRRADLRA